ncbi:NAD(P)-dependent oxidoreductase [Oceanospirillum sediminis]|uniref:Glyoxylate/hydroxypyruvate reductase A n=1 Tax=Oceanospirillum sediminis TaxID=2760088 RepID=A0A839IQ25_9GAMM|nr:NAD(P)-dependent oxidoreductase [Oceanospirillum sediminis]MBB1486774.1 glyoxylate/hydroxypyruvate reductase A [Oceanospirillum sediminis]
MRILLATPETDQEPYLKSLKKYCPYADIRLWQEVSGTDWQAEYALVWKPENSLFIQQKKLVAIFNLGAGIDALECLPDLPKDTPLYKLRDAGMGQWMLEYVLYGILHFGRHFDRYRTHQEHHHWKPENTRDLREKRIGILGLGPIGRFVGQQLYGMGYTVAGWSRTEKTDLSFPQSSGIESLNGFISQSHFLINLLPATEDTFHILNADRLMRLPRDAVVISSGRGSVFDEHALLLQLQTRHLKGALLDVFEHEPLPEEHPFWYQSNIIVTPHIAAPTQADDAIKQVLADILDIELGGDHLY